MKLRLALAQVNPTVGDLAGNAALIIKRAHDAHAAGAHMAIFPEMVLTGYPVEDLALRPSFQAASKSALATLAQEINPNIVSIVGYLDHLDGRPQNMVAVIAEGEVRARYAKCHLPITASLMSTETLSPEIQLWWCAFMASMWESQSVKTVSYTHLTLPTIYSV